MFPVFNRKGFRQESTLVSIRKRRILFKIEAHTSFYRRPRWYAEDKNRVCNDEIGQNGRFRIETKLVNRDRMTGGSGGSNPCLPKLDSSFLTL